jgi:hypothetical protein
MHEKDTLPLKAAKHTAEARAMVARQGERVARLRASGCCTLGAEEMLYWFQRSLVIFEQQERQLRALADDDQRYRLIASSAR